MKPQELVDLGIPYECVPDAFSVIKKVVWNYSKSDLKEKLSVVAKNPKDYSSDSEFSSLANSIIHFNETKLQEIENYSHNPYKQSELKIWGNEIDDATIDQMKAAMEIPVSVAGVLCPDAHLGYGISVGGVLATYDSVLPNAVGVDIACFTGDTEIPLLDGKNYKIKDLAEKGGKIFVWACKPDGKIVASEATALKTKENSPLVKICIDNGEEIRCTPDEEFMLRNGTYKQAKDLVEGDSLMPFYSQLDKEGYVRIQQNYSGTLQRAHWIVARSGLLGDIPKFEGQKTVIHHQDFQESNNWPTNLQFMGNKDHSSYHRSLVEKNLHWQSKEFEEKRIEALKNKAKTPDGYNYYAERGSRNFKSYWERDYEKAKLNCSGNGQRGKEYLIARNQSPEGKAKSKEISNRIHNCEVCGEKVKSYIGLYNHKKLIHGMYNNHKVVSVTHLQEKEDVYCLKVPKYENFAIKAGVFVHNCRMRLSITDYPVGKLDDVFSPKVDPMIRALANGTVFGVGGRQKAKIEHKVMDADWNITPITKEMKDKAWTQLGTSGSGNHFAEWGILTLPEDDLGLKAGNYVALLSHSGSRGSGAAVCRTYLDIAKSKLPKKFDKYSNLAWLSLQSNAGQEYWNAMNLMGDYAAANHEVIHNLVSEILGTQVLAVIENHHNFAWKEKHGDQELIVHRKGATPAGKGVLGIIPGSMADPAFVVKGKGKAESLYSASHGAGRRMSRTKAIEKFNWSTWKSELKRRGVRLLSGGLDEVPGAYKDIHTVMSQQTDLVDVIGRFDPKIVKMSDDGTRED